jgi:hypothetical protein
MQAGLNLNIGQNSTPNISVLPVNSLILGSALTNNSRLVGQSVNIISPLITLGSDLPASALNMASDIMTIGIYGQTLDIAMTASTAITIFSLGALNLNGTLISIGGNFSSIQMTGIALLNGLPIMTAGFNQNINQFAPI